MGISFLNNISIWMLTSNRMMKKSFRCHCEALSAEVPPFGIPLTSGTSRFIGFRSMAGFWEAELESGAISLFSTDSRSRLPAFYVKSQEP
jgi:hypothetical protein